MKVILQQDVKGLGKQGQLVEASDGYVRNFLLPRKLAVEATASNLNTMKQQEAARKHKAETEKAAACLPHTFLFQSYDQNSFSILESCPSIRSSASSSS